MLHSKNQAKNSFFTYGFPNGDWLLGRPSVVEVHGGHGQHEVAVVTFGFPPLHQQRPPQQTPIIINYGEYPNAIQTFFGYVNHYESSSDPLSNSYEMWCIGTSLPMNNVNPQSWQNVSASFIASQIAERYHLRLVVSQFDEVLDFWAQGNETDFHMLTRLANRAGARFWVNGSTMYFISPDRLVEKAGSTGALRLEMNGDHFNDTLVGLDIVSGSLAPGSDPLANQSTFGMVRTSTGSGSSLGTLVQATSAGQAAERGLVLPALNKIVAYAASDMAEAQRLSDSSFLLGNWSQAKAAITHNQTVRTGNIVDLVGARVSDNDKGLWVVAGYHEVFQPKIDEDVKTTTRTTHLDLIRNQQNIQYFGSGSVLINYIPQVNATLSGTQWVSATGEVIYV